MARNAEGIALAIQEEQGAITATNFFFLLLYSRSVRRVIPNESRATARAGKF